MSNYNTPGFARRVAVAGDYAYVADESGGGLQVIDISDPTTPTLVGSLTTINPRDIALAGEHAYIADYVVGLRVVDLQGRELGRVDHLIETGANDVLVVRGERERLIPYLRGRVIHDVDLIEGRIQVDWDPDF